MLAVEKIKTEKKNGDISKENRSGQRESRNVTFNKDLKEKRGEVFLQLQKEYSRKKGIYRGPEGCAWHDIMRTLMGHCDLEDIS